MTKEKEKMMDFCKAAVPFVDKIQRLAVEFGLPAEKVLGISICGNNYADMSVKMGDIFYSCIAQGEEEYRLSALGDDPDSFESLLPFGTIPRTQEGNETNESAQNDPEQQEDKPWRSETNIIQGRMTG